MRLRQINYHQFISSHGKDGLITRKTHSTDKRSAYIYLTEKGLQMAHKVKEICFSIDDKALKNIPPQEKQHL